jgi:hypothetical protein
MSGLIVHLILCLNPTEVFREHVRWEVWKAAQIHTCVQQQARLVKISEKKILVKITRKVEIVSTKLIGHNLMYLYLNVLIS